MLNYWGNNRLKSFYLLCWFYQRFIVLIVIKSQKLGWDCKGDQPA